MEPYFATSYPYWTEKRNIMHYERERIPPNWHTQFKFIYIVKGAVKRVTNGVEMTLEEGNGLFINSGILHGAQGIQNIINANHRFAIPKT